MATIGRLVVQIGADVGGLTAGLQTAQSKLKGFGSQMKSIGTGLTLGLSAPIAGIAGAALNSASDFEQSMNLMQATSGATGAQMQVLQAQALDLGATTSFSAGEAAGAMLELAKAGMNVEQVGAAIPGVMDLAAAGGIGLADAATITANAINSFGLEAGAATSVANTFAAAANASSADVGDLAQGFQMAGAVFASNNQSVEDLAAGLAILSNNGIAGSDAGTSLKTMLMRLTAPTGKAAEVIDELGINVYDAAGNMRAMPDILGDMNQALYGTNAVTTVSSNLTSDQAARMKYLKGTIEQTQTKLMNYQSGIVGATQSEEKRAQSIAQLNSTLSAAQAEYAGLANVGSTTNTVMRMLTDEQRNAALTTIFGADAIRAATILAGEGADGFASMSDAVGQEGAAAAMAQAQMKGLAGAIEYFKGSIDSLLIGAALPFLDTLGGMVRGAADLLTGFTTLSPETQRFAAVLLGVLAVAGPTLMILGTMATALAGLLSPVGLVIGAVALLGVGFATNFMGMRDAVMNAWAAIQPYLMQAYAWFMAMLPGALAALQAGFSTAWTAVSSAVSTAWAAIQPLLTQAWTWFVASLPGALAAMQAFFITAWTAASTAVSTAWAVIAPLLTQAWTWLMASLPGALAVTQAFFATAWAAVSAAVSTAWAVVAPLLTQAWAWMQATLPGALTTLQTGFTTAWPAISAAVSTAWGVIQSLLTTMQSWFSGTLPGALTSMQSTFTTALTAIQSAWQTLAGFFGPAIERVKESFTGLSTQVEPVKTAISGLLTAFQNLWVAVQPIVAALGIAIGAVLGVAALTTINAFSAAMTALGPVVTTVIDTITGVLNGFATFFGGIVALVSALISGDWDGVWAAAETIVQGAIDVVTSIIQGLYDFTAEIFTALATTVTTTLSDLGVNMSTIVDGIKAWWADKWNAMVGFVQPAIDIVGSLQTKIQGFADWIGSIHIPNPFAGLSLPSMPSWVPGFATGTLSAPGGMALVGERGPELINLPRGARVWTNSETRSMLAGAGAGGDGPTINMGPVYVSDKVDVEALAYRVATINARRGR